MLLKHGYYNLLQDDMSLWSRLSGLLNVNFSSSVLHYFSIYDSAVYKNEYIMKHLKSYVRNLPLGFLTICDLLFPQKQLYHGTTSALPTGAVLDASLLSLPLLVCPISL